MLLVMSIVIAIVGVLVVRWFLNTRDADLRAINCDIINRQVTGTRIALDQAILFRTYETSVEIRAYFAKLVPVRAASLAQVTADQKRLKCKEPS